MAFERMRIFTGNANPRLAEAVCKHLNISLGRAVVGRFSDGEVMIELLENVRGRDVFILQSTCAPTNDSLMEVMVMIDALKRASAARITAALPYFGYARQDRRPRSARVPISAKVVADMLVTVGVHRVMVMDLNADQIQGFFNIPDDNIYATPVLLGGPADGVVAARMQQANPALQSQTGRTTLTRSAALIKHAAGLVGVDTGLTHMGIALGIPTVALFGSTRPYLDTTRPNARVLYHRLECSPCRRHPTCGGAYTCMRLIEVAEVMATLAAVMNREAHA